MEGKVCHEDSQQLLNLSVLCWSPCAKIIFSFKSITFEKPFLFKLSPQPHQPTFVHDLTCIISGGFLNQKIYSKIPSLTFSFIGLHVTVTGFYHLQGLLISYLGLKACLSLIFVYFCMLLGLRKYSPELRHPKHEQNF